jgi:hypothetical protein
MKYCPDCQRELPDNAIRCPYCGADATGLVTIKLPDARRKCMTDEDVKKSYWIFWKRIRA